MSAWHGEASDWTQQPSDDLVERQLVKDALSIATLGTPGEIALQIATNAVRAARKHDAATITALRQRVAELEGAVLVEREACAKVMENLCFFTPIEELMGMTKQQMSVRTCREGAKEIRNRSNDHAD